MIQLRMDVFLRIILLIFITIGLTACIEVKQRVNINKDGSGDVRVEFVVMEMWASQVIPQLKSAMNGWSIVEEKVKDGKQIIVFRREFKNISELNSEAVSYTLTSERKGFFKKTYAINIKFLKSHDMPFPYEITIKMPGNIYETNGTKLSSGEVRWSLYGIDKGVSLSAKSSGFAMPDFASLREAFNSAFDKIYYRDALLFLRDGNLWVMDNDGKNQRQLTKGGIGSWSVSKDGRKIVYEEKNNCYVNLLGSKVQKLTDTDNCLSPVISPDGSKVAFIKIDEKFNAAEAQQLESNVFIPEYVKEGAIKKTGIYFIDLKTKEQKRVVGELPAIFVPKKWGSTTSWYDSSLYWSPDGNSLHFMRNFIDGQQNAYLINIATNKIDNLGYQAGYVLNWNNGKIIYADNEGFCSIYDIIKKKEQREGLNDFYNFDCLDVYGEKVLFFSSYTSDYSMEGIVGVYDTKTGKYNIIDRDRPDGIRGKFSPDGKTIVYGMKGELWVIGIDGNNKKQLVLNFPLSSESWFLEDLSWSPDGRLLITLVDVDNVAESIWIVNLDGSNLKKLADDASSPRWVSIPRISFIAPTVAKTIILIAIALIGFLFLFTLVMVTWKTVKAVVTKIPKGKSASTTEGVSCIQCGTQNPESASFCLKCGQRLKE